MHIHIIRIFILLIPICACQFISNRIDRNRYDEIENITDKYSIDYQCWVKLNEKEKIDEYIKINGRIYCGGIGCGAEPMEGVDMDSFCAIPNSKYAKDKEYVYYPLSIICFSGLSCGRCFCEDYIIDSASPNTFQYLGNGYAKDGEKVFFRGEIIKEADGNSFKVIEGGENFYFGVDKKFVYSYSKVFPEADAETFYYEKYDPKTEYIMIIGDKYNKWKYFPPSTFVKVNK